MDASHRLTAYTTSDLRRFVRMCEQPADKWSRGELVDFLFDQDSDEWMGSLHSWAKHWKRRPRRDSNPRFSD